jgi:hypothetical protein
MRSVALVQLKSPRMSLTLDAVENNRTMTIAFSSEGNTRGRFPRLVHPYVTRRKETGMEVLYPRCCGLDVHKSSITACVLIAQSGKLLKHIRRFGCTTRELRELVVWLQELCVEQVAMEPRDVYWKACVEHSGKSVSDRSGKRPAHQGRSRTEDGHEGPSVDRGTLATRTTAGQLHSAVWTT